MDSSFDLSWGFRDDFDRYLLILFPIRECKVFVLEVQPSCDVSNPEPEAPNKGKLAE